jgi:hypothetical protein
MKERGREMKPPPRNVNNYHKLEEIRNRCFPPQLPEGIHFRNSRIVVE